LDKNYGFAEGYNRGLAQIQADYYLLLNSDVEVAPDWLSPLMELMESDPQIAACQPKILAYQAKEKHLFEHAGAAGGWLDKWGYPFCRGRIFDTVETDQGQYAENTEIFWATGAALLVRASLYQQFGGLDGDFFAHMEEIDFCWRLKRAGYKIFYCADSVVWHVGGGTLDAENPRKTYLNFRNNLAMLVKNTEGFGATLWLIGLRLVLDGVAGVKFLTQARFAHIWAIIRAHFAFYGRLGAILGKRKQIQTLLKNKVPQPVFNQVGVYPNSILWAYFIQKKKTFKELANLPESAKK
jgi:GT2 family glycosyltransferase